ncbi:MAG: DsbA family protein [Candidatus Aenigmarchaeota archaeon]|nr:DsbA family protein [Candidatus Aenigmarchaeota archaeon]
MHKCPECGKSFDTEDAMNQHTQDKHAVRAAPAQEKKGSKARMLGIATVIIVIIIVIAAAFLLLSRPAYVPNAAEVHAKGNGATEIAEYSDFQCPACGTAYPQLKEFFEEHPDSARLVYKHFPLTQIHPYAFKAAEASECAADQGNFWEYHDVLFGNQRNLLRTDLINYAEDISLDIELFTKCLDSGVMAGRVNADLSEGKDKGVRATPTFFIDGEKFEGALSVEDLEREVGVA